MSRMTPFSSPLLLGFDAMEKTLERLAKTGDSYPPYNIERLSGARRHGRKAAHHAGRRRFRGQRSRGHHRREPAGRARPAERRHRARISCIAASPRGSSSADFVLADGMRVIAAELKNGLLSIDLDRPEPERLVRKINISVKD